MGVMLQTITSNILTSQNIRYTNGVTNEETRTTSEKNTSPKKTTHSRPSSSGAIHMMDMGKCITTTTMVHPTNIMIATMNQCTERLMKKQLFINQNHINQSHTNQNHLISQNQAILRL